jgi:hypothetical protein
MMIVPEAANMPPTPCQTEILALGNLRRSVAAHLAHAFLQRIHAVHPGVHVGETAGIGVERQLQIAAGAVLRSAIKDPASPRVPGRPALARRPGDQIL